MTERAECCTPNIQTLVGGVGATMNRRQLGSPLKVAPGMLSVTVGMVVPATTPTMTRATPEAARSTSCFDAVNKG
jgi:hypothetical protein